MYPVSSSHIEEVGYDSSIETVFVRFKNNSLYIYKGVCESEFENLRTASSVGAYLRQYYMDNYPYEKIE